MFPLDELEKIEVIRDRLGVTYEEARDALRANDNDLVETLVALEHKQTGFSKKLEDRGREVVDNIGTWFSKSHSTRVKLKKGQKTVVEIPATVGVAGMVAVLFSTPLAIASALGAVAAMANDYHIDIDKPDKEE